MPGGHQTRDDEKPVRTDTGDARPRDAGRTSGGGSLGHKQPHDVAEQTNIRNQPDDQREDSIAQGDLDR